MFDNSPFYHRPNNGSTLTDIISNSYDSLVDKAKYASRVSYECMVNDWNILKSKKSIDTVSNNTCAMSNNYDLNKTLILATGVSMIANALTTAVSGEINKGYAAESVVYTPAFAIVYCINAWKHGESRLKIGVDLAVLGIVGATLSLVPYQHYRGKMIDYGINHIDAWNAMTYGAIHTVTEFFAYHKLVWTGVVAATTQLALLPPFGAVMNAAKFGINYFDKKYNFKKHMMNSTEKVATNISKVSGVAKKKVKNNFENLKNGIKNGSNGLHY